MADVIGVELDTDTLVLTAGRDFRWAFELTDDHDAAVPFPAGNLFFEFLPKGGTALRWNFVIAGSLASIKVESDQVALVGHGARWQLVWMPDGEAVGGDPWARGKVVVQL